MASQAAAAEDEEPTEAAEAAARMSPERSAQVSTGVERGQLGLQLLPALTSSGSR